MHRQSAVSHQLSTGFTDPVSDLARIPARRRPPAPSRPRPPHRGVGLASSPSTSMPCSGQATTPAENVIPSSPAAGPPAERRSSRSAICIASTAVWLGASTQSSSSSSGRPRRRRGCCRAAPRRRSPATRLACRSCALAVPPIRPDGVNSTAQRERVAEPRRSHLGQLVEAPRRMLATGPRRELAGARRPSSAGTDRLRRGRRRPAASPRTAPKAALAQTCGGSSRTRCGSSPSSSCAQLGTRQRGLQRGDLAGDRGDRSRAPLSDPSRCSREPAPRSQTLAEGRTSGPQQPLCCGHNGRPGRIADLRPNRGCGGRRGPCRASPRRRARGRRRPAGRWPAG